MPLLQLLAATLGSPDLAFSSNPLSARYFQEVGTKTCCWRHGEASILFIPQTQKQPPQLREQPKKETHLGLREMIENLHNLIYQNCRNCGGIVQTGSCRISIINGMNVDACISAHEAPSTDQLDEKLV